MLRIDCWNALLVSFPDSSPQPLREIQHTAARLNSTSHCQRSCSQLPKKLHWLSVSLGIECKTALHILTLLVSRLQSVSQNMLFSTYNFTILVFPKSLIFVVKDATNLSVGPFFLCGCKMPTANQISSSLHETLLFFSCLQIEDKGLSLLVLLTVVIFKVVLV